MKKNMIKDVKQAQRILIFNVNWLGDVLFSTATIRNIRRNFPDSFIACIVPSRCYPLLKDNPYIDEVLIFDEKDRHKGITSKLAFVRLLKTKRFDTVFLLHRSFTRSLICRLADIPIRIGYYTPKRGFLLTRKIKPPKRDSLHRIDYYLNIIEKAGLRVEDRYTDFFISDEDKKAVDDFLKDNLVKKEDFLVGMNPGANWKPKRWPHVYWAELADRLVEAYQAKVIVTGSYKDAHLSSQIQSQMKTKPIIACGAFNLKQLGALFQRLDVFVSADTGPLHIANASGAKRILAIFGPTHPALTGPYPAKKIMIVRKDVGCKIPCYEVHCKDNRCMKAITPDEAFKEVKRLIEVG